jgi:hypothetical protein
MNIEVLLLLLLIKITIEIQIKKFIYSRWDLKILKKGIKMKFIIWFLATLSVLAFIPATNLAADMWAETPDISYDRKPSNGISDSAIIVNKKPSVNLWVETPDLHFGNKNYAVELDEKIRLVHNLNPEMYKETPDLNMIYNVVKKDKEVENKEDFFAVERKSGSVLYWTSLCAEMTAK